MVFLTAATKGLVTKSWNCTSAFGAVRPLQYFISFAVASNFAVEPSNCTAKGAQPAAASASAAEGESAGNDLADVNYFAVGMSFLFRVSVCGSQVVTAAIWVYCPTLLS